MNLRTLEIWQHRVRLESQTVITPKRPRRLLQIGLTCSINTLRYKRTDRTATPTGERELLAILLVGPPVSGSENPDCRAASPRDACPCGMTSLTGDAYAPHPIRTLLAIAVSRTVHKLHEYLFRDVVNLTANKNDQWPCPGIIMSSPLRIRLVSS